MAVSAGRNLGSFGQCLGKARSFVHRRLGDTRHEQRVMAIASRLFDLTKPLHHLGQPYRRLLKLGAMLHDVGRCHGDRKHHIRGSQMVCASRALGLSSLQRAFVAYLTRYHRGRSPSWGEGLEALGEHEYGNALVLAALLRAADSLDSRRLDQPTLVVRLRNDRLEIRCYVQNNRQEASRVFGKRSKYRLLKQVLSIDVNFEVCPLQIVNAGW